MNSQDDVTVSVEDTALGLGSYGASDQIYSLSSSGIDTITLNSPFWSGGTLSPYTTAIPSGGGGSGYTITTNGTGAGTYNWNNTTLTNTTVHIDTDGLTMKEGADIKIGGKSLTKAIEQIEERLGILHPNPALEERWDKLKDLRRQYMEMEKDILEKEKIMKILKEA